MNRQIEEMAFDLCVIDTCKHLTREECADTTCAHCEAEALYNAGYRKQEDVAREIFAEIDKMLDISITHTPLRMPFCWIDIRFISYYNELRKKYGVTEE